MKMEPSFGDATQHSKRSEIIILVFTSIHLAIITLFAVTNPFSFFPTAIDFFRGTLFFRWFIFLFKEEPIWPGVEDMTRFVFSPGAKLGHTNTIAEEGDELLLKGWLKNQKEQAYSKSYDLKAINPAGKLHCAHTSLQLNSPKVWNFWTFKTASAKINK